MCYAIPGEVVGLEGSRVVVDFLGDRRRVALVDPDGPAVGDFVYAQGGVVVSTVPRPAARRILAAWREALVELDRLDEAMVAAGIVAGTALDPLLDRAEAGEPLGRDDLARLLAPRDAVERRALRATGNRVRRRAAGNAACVHGIVAIGSRCVNDCAYCGLRAGNRELARYRLTHDEVLAAAVAAVDGLGFRALVLQAGEDPGWSTDELADLVREVRGRCQALVVVSLGAREPTCLDELHAAGARGLLLRFETSDPSLYAALHRGPKADREARLAALRRAKALGWVVATGSLVGLPGQTAAHVADDLLLARALGADMVTLGPFVPHPRTPLATAAPAGLDLALDAMAAARLLCPRVAIPVTTALERLAPDAGRDGLLAGANSLMVDVTPTPYRARYDLYPGRDAGDARADAAAAAALLRSLGRAPTDLGRS